MRPRLILSRSGYKPHRHNGGHPPAPVPGLRIGSASITTIGTVNTLIPPSTYLAVDDTYVYWAGEVDDTIRRAPKAGGESIALVSGLVTPSATGFFVTDSNLFYFAQQCGSYLIEDGVRVCSTPGGVYFVDRNGGGRHTVIENDTSYVGVAVDAAVVYVTNQFNGTLKSIAK